MSKRPSTLNDKKWDDLFSKYAILDKINAEGKAIVSAAQIKEFREPRLMAKIDHSINKPEIFIKHDLSILPISRRRYVISNFAAYQPLEVINDDIRQMSLPPHLQSLSVNDVPSEAIAINCALASGILADFLGEEHLDATVSGRMSSGTFDFKVKNSATGDFSPINVDNAQIEIDAAFEGINSLALIEAKIDLSKDFIIRQLYYPYRTWQERVTKKVRPVFFVFSNGIYNLYEYEFQDITEYNSLCLVRHARYSIEDDMNIEMSDLQNLASQTELVDEPSIPFPQADSFERVINLCELLGTKDYARDDITDKYAFDARQTNYYTDAARYLGLVDRKRVGRQPIYNLSPLGQRILKLSYKQRQLAFCERILSHHVFREVFNLCCTNGSMPENDEIADVMRHSHLYNIGSDSTFDRRASTVRGWINWMFNLLS